MVIKAKWIKLLTLIAGAAISTAEASEWQLVEDSSTVRFIGVQEGSAFRARFENFTAMINFDPQNPTAGKIKLVGIPVEYSETPGSIRLPPPLLGQHNDEVYGEILGLSTDDITQLKSAGTI